MLFVANANTNNLAVVNVKEPGASAPLGFIPVGWYPTSVRVARDGKTIYVANGKGASSKANRDGPRPGFRRAGARPIEYIGGLFQGTLSIIPMPDAKRDGGLLADRLRVQPAAAGRPDRRPRRRSPRRATRSRPRSATRRRSSTCVYIIKENRTYDQVFGDMPEGNGEPSICLFPEAVTPNHHALAREFVLLDNFYVESEVSADGHEWSMGAYASDFVERIWPLGYRGDRRVPYPVGGERVRDRQAGRRLHLGQGRREGGHLPQLRRVRRQCADARPARHDAGQDPGGPLRPDVPRLRHGLSRRQARRPLPRGAGRVREGRRDAATGDPPAAQRPHLGDLARQVDA